MAFEPVKLVHPKTGVVVVATTPVDLTNFRFNDGYVAADTARLLVGAEGGEAKYPKLVEGLKQVEAIEKDEAASDEDAKVDVKSEVASDDKSAPKPTTGGTAAKPASAPAAAK